MIKNNQVITHQFLPTEIIFASTSECNLHCEHCFIQRKINHLSIEKSIALLQNCSEFGIEKIGFSGGEPFLFMDFLQSLIPEAINQNLLFDRIMTNGIWWKSKNELSEKLTALYDAGYDGKIGLSFDSYHQHEEINTYIEKISFFIHETIRIFQNPAVIDIQMVKKNSEIDNTLIHLLSEKLNTKISNMLNKTGYGFISLENDQIFISINLTRLSLQTSNSKNWIDKDWFKDDFCQGPGQLLFVHPDGNIAPCCGFANENNFLFIGTINDSLNTILNNASNNYMVKTCYQTGLENARKKLEKQGVSFPGKTLDQCMFCDYLCTILKNKKP